MMYVASFVRKFHSVAWFQAVESFCKVGLRRCVAVFKAGYAECLSRPIQVTSIQSLQSECREYPPAALVIVDEAHCAISDSFTELIAHYKARTLFVVISCWKFHRHVHVIVDDDIDAGP